MAERIGFYICHCGINIASKVRCAEVAEFISGLDDVVVSRDYLFMCSDPGQELIEKDVAEYDLTRVVVASCSPRMHENTFRAVCARAGLNPYRSFHHVCVREHVSWVHKDEDEATLKAKELSLAGVLRVVHQEDLFSQTFPVNTNTLIVGGGIAGMQAALDVASSGYTAYLVEKTPTIGGHMLQYDKTFPTLDCAACIGTPKMVSVGQHPDIELLSLSEVEEVSGFIGNFKVRVRQKARYIDADKCTGCGECTSMCPVSFPNEWDVGTLRRKAVYRPFPQAVPITFAIDKRGVPMCQDSCPLDTRVQGYVNLVAQERFREAIDIVRDVNPMPGVLGRVCHHPCEAQCQRGHCDEPLAICAIKRFLADWEMENGGPAEPEKPESNGKRVAVVGSGPAGLFAAYYLSREGYGVTIFEQLPVAGGLLRTGIPAFRLPRDVLDREIQWILDHGVELRLNTPVGAEMTMDKLFEEGFDSVVLAIGTTKSRKLNIPGEDLKGVIGGLEYLREINLEGNVKTGKKVAVIGGGNAAMDSARTALRAGADQVTVVYRRSRAEMPAIDSEIEEADEEGIKFHFLSAPVEIVGEDGEVTAIKCLKMELGEPDESGRRRPVPVEGSEFDIPVDMVIPAISQMPDTDPFCDEKDMETTRWGTLKADGCTCETGRKGVFGCGDGTNGPGTVVEAAASGRRAARAVNVYLTGGDFEELKSENDLPRMDDVDTEGIKREPRVKIPASGASVKTFDEVEKSLTAEEAVKEASRCLTCGGCCDCRTCITACKAEAIDYDMKDTVKTLDVGSIIVATGFDAMDPSVMKEYGYGKYPNVFTNLEFERLSNATGPTGGKILMRDPDDAFKFANEPQSAAILHCIGSRDHNYHEYCSRTCCMYALKYAHLIKDKVGEETEIYNFYIDMRCFGDGYEEFMKRIQSEGVRMIRGKAAMITDQAESPEESGKLIVVAEDTLVGSVIRVPVDMAILCTAMEPRSDSQDVARVFGIGTKASGFFLEEHPKLEPVSTATSGVFVAGACQSPKDIPDSVAQAKGAASEAISLSAKGEVTVSPMISHIDPDICIGCQVCIGLCPYSAIEFDDRHGISVVNDAVCKGCGSCAAYCPSSAARIRNFSYTQVFAEIDGLLSTVRS